MPAQSVNEKLADFQIRHSVSLSKLENKIVRKIIELLNRADLDLVQQIQKYDPTELTGARSRARLETMLEAIREIIADSNRQLNNNLSGELKSLAKYEAGFQANLLASAIPVAIDLVTPPAELLNALVTKDPLKGRLLKEWTQSFSADKYAKVGQAIRLGLVEGQSISQIVQRVRGTRALQFKDGVLETTRRSAEALVRTSVADVSMRARDSFYQANKDIIAKVQWTATLDTRTCVRCAALDGEVFNLGDGPRPPLHINCFPADTLVATRDGITGASKHWYDGELCVIRTAAGKQLSCTPNHPILTDRGFLPASSINVGSNVISDLAHVGSVLTVDMDDKHIPSRIEDVAEAAFRSSEMLAGPMPITAEDFHGDGRDSDIAIIATNRPLANGVEPAPFKMIGNLPLALRNVCLALLSGRSSLSSMCFRLLLASHRVVSCFDKSLTLYWRSSLHALGLLLGPIARFNPSGQQVAVNGGSFAPEMFGNAKDANSVIEHCKHFINWQRYLRREGGRPELNADFLQMPDDSIGADAILVANLLAGKSGGVILDNVVSIERSDFSGHVYNLETKLGAYLANGIWVHNCRCTTVPITKSYRSLGIDLNELPPGTRASMNGQVPATMTYEEWLRKQGAETQDDVLGKTKGALFRRGRLKLDRFVNRANEELTIDELKKTEAEAFKRANLSA